MLFIQSKDNLYAEGIFKENFGASLIREEKVVSNHSISLVCNEILSTVDEVHVYGSPPQGSTTATSVCRVLPMASEQ